MRPIHSLNELPEDERDTVRSAAIRTGLFTCVLGIVILYFLGFYPFTMETGFVFFITLVLSFVPPFLLFVFGYAISESVKLAKLGYYIPAPTTPPYQPNSLTTTTFHPLKPFEFNTYQPTPNHHSSMSINPASGLPMCGSSGIDVRGNPYGTNSWS